LEVNKASVKLKGISNVKIIVVSIDIICSAI
jgi:hypothetical protein